MGLFDLDALATAAGDGPGGVVWSLAGAEQLNANLVVLPPHGEIGEHRNDTVEVLVVGLSGEVEITVDGEPWRVGPGRIAVVPLHTRRALRAGADGARYLTAHVRREPLGIRPTR